jgi:hypothetical protein
MGDLSIYWIANRLQHVPITEDAMETPSHMGDHWKAAMTMLAVEKTREFLENAKDAWGEATIQTSLGALNHRVLDVVQHYTTTKFLLS